MGCLHSKTNESGDFAHEALRRHNELRKLHGCPPLKLSKDLCKSAQEHADKMRNDKNLRHSNKSGVGENVGYKMHSAKVECTGKQGTDMWYSEIKMMKFGENEQMQSGHFSQVIWKNSTEVGFGVAYTRDNTEVYFVGQYSPPGNYRGQWNENVPPPVSGKIYVPE